MALYGPSTHIDMPHDLTCWIYPDTRKKTQNNYYSKDEVNALILEALQKLDYDNYYTKADITSMLDTHIKSQAVIDASLNMEVDLKLDKILEDQAAIDLALDASINEKIAEIVKMLEDASIITALKIEEIKNSQVGGDPWDTYAGQ